MFVGREDQLRDLKALCEKQVASLVTCRGRRRIGKSTLISEFARQIKARFLHLEGVKPQRSFSNETELKAFHDQLEVQSGKKFTMPENWTEAFVQLDRCIRSNQRTVVLLDEISWFGHYEPAFADTIRICWDGYWKRHDRLIVVLCGSVSSWIKENIVDNGAFLGRRSQDIVVKELPLPQCVSFWGKKAQRLSSREILDVLSVTGGVPRYLEEINPSLSAAENIKRLCFTPNGVLRTDFEDMFKDVVTEEQSFSGRILRALVDRPRTAAEISHDLSIPRNGRVSDALKRLVEAGFISSDSGKNPETGKDVAFERYRIKDNYARFFLKYIEPVKEVIDSGRYAFKSLEALENWNTIMGLQFENLVVNNYQELIPFLHLNDVLLTSVAPYRKNAVPSKKQKGVQIDLLIQSRKTNYIIEIKRKNEISRNIITEVDEKIDALKRPKTVSFKTALVYAGELTPIVEADGYFDAIISAEVLLGLA